MIKRILYCFQYQNVKETKETTINYLDKVLDQSRLKVSKHVSSCSGEDDAPGEAGGRSYISFTVGPGVDVLGSSSKLSSGLEANEMGLSKRIKSFCT